MDEPPRLAVKAIIVDRGRLRVTRNVGLDGTFYLLPGGGQRRGESVTDALRRECLEEVGARVEIGELIFVRDYIAAHHEFARLNPEFHQVALMFRCSLADGDMRTPSSPDGNQVGVEWLELAQVVDLPLFPKTIRPHLARLDDVVSPVYLGDVN